ncbi:hypothetical protein V6N13_128172 [Hibiscus sabdariffa]
MSTASRGRAQRETQRIFRGRENSVALSRKSAFTSAEDGMDFGDFDFHHKGMKSALFRIVDDKRDDVGPLEKFLQLFPLDMRFHLHDLVGSDHLKTAHTPTSVVVRFSNDLI